MEKRHVFITRSSAIILAATVFCASWGTSTLISGISVFRSLGFATIAILIANGLLDGKISRIKKTELGLALLWLWCIASVTWSVDTQMSLVAISGSLLAFLLFMATSRISAEPHYWKWIGLAYVLGCLVASVTVFTNAAIFVASGQGDDRATVGEINANYIAYSIATSIPIALTLVSHQSNRWFVNLSALVYVAIATIAVLLTGSRGAMGAVGASILIYAFLSARKQLFRSVFLIIFAVIGIYSIFDYLPESVKDRANFISNFWSEGGQSVDLSGREYVWPLAINSFLENIFSGIGVGAFRSINGEGIAVHNAVLTMAAETGLIGLLLFIFSVSTVFTRVVLKSQNPRVRKGGILLFATWLPIAMTGVWESSAVAWMAFGWYYGASFHPYAPGEVEHNSNRKRLVFRW